MCGKNLISSLLLNILVGSPPRVREKQVMALAAVFASGITPACAGKTDIEARKNEKKRDHPRVCGKNALAFSIPEPYAGSPPRVREKQVMALAAVFASGITPACAGKTDIEARKNEKKRDHPRVCGKNALAFSIPEPYAGSPPRVREKRQ